MNKKIKIRIEKQFVNYIYINQKKYFNFKIVDFEIYFKYCIKSVDMLGIDENYYYIIEVKRDRITEEDYNNLVWIMKKNKYDKPFKGILIGTRGNKRVEELCSKNENIECKIINDVKYEKKADKFKYFYIYNKKKNHNTLLKKVFAHSDGMNIENYNISHDYIDIDYKYENYKLRLRVNSKNDVLYVFKKHILFNDLWYEHKKECIDIGSLEKKLFLLKNRIDIRHMDSYLINSRDMIRDYNAIYSLVFPLTICSKLRELKFDGNNNLSISSTIFMGLFIKKIKVEMNSEYIIIPRYYDYIIRNNTELLNQIKSSYDYNIAYIIESCYIFIGKKLYKPSIKININDKYIIVKLSIELKNGKKIKKEYGITNKNTIFKKGNFKDEFYLICNIYFILNFEEYVKKYIKKTKSSIDEKYYDGVTSCIYKNKLLGTGKTKKMTLRQIIKMTNNEYKRGYDEVMKEEYNRVKVLKSKKV